MKEHLFLAETKHVYEINPSNISTHQATVSSLRPDPQMLVEELELLYGPKLPRRQILNTLLTLLPFELPIDLQRLWNHCQLNIADKRTQVFS